MKAHPEMKVSVQSDNPYNDLKAFGVNVYPKSESRTPVYLVKVGEKQFMERLLFQGEVFMNTLASFRKIEDIGGNCSDGRGDAYEGIDAFFQVSGLYIGNNLIEGVSPIRYNLPGGIKGLIYCLFGVYDDTEDVPSLIPQKLLEMGDTAIIINDPMVFIDRCATAAKAAGGKLFANSVQYYDEREGNYFLTPWLKRKKYFYQSEYRLFIPCNNDKPLSLTIGPIDDIAEMVSLK